MTKVIELEKSSVDIYLRLSLKIKSNQLISQSPKSVVLSQKHQVQAKAVNNMREREIFSCLSSSSLSYNVALYVYVK